MIRSILVVSLCSFLAGCSGPPALPVVHAKLASGLTVEVIGLRRWSLQMIDDSLAKYAPGESLASHACIANLRYKLGFADAHIIRFDTTEVFDTDTMPTRGTMILFVREPQDSARVHQVVHLEDDTARVAEWRPLTNVFQSDPGLFYSFYHAYLRGDAAAKREFSDSQWIEWAGMREVLAREHLDSGYAKALRVLAQSPSNPDRSVAALILLRRSDKDETWRALLMASVADPQWVDAEVARDVLQTMSDLNPRTVDWTPVAPVIRNVLDGTGLAALTTVINVLLRTGIDQRSAPALLAHGGEMLTALLEVSNEEVRKPAHELLIKLRGEDLGRAPAPWRKWIATLQ